MQIPEPVSIYFQSFPGVITQDLLRYVLGAGGVYLIVNILLSTRLAARKIRGENPPSGQIRSEITASLRTVLIFSAVGTSIAAGKAFGFFQIYLDIEEMGLGYLLLSTVLIIILHDAYFYWTHRLMHRQRFIRKLHRLHHRSYYPTPFTSYSFDAGEAVINATFFPLVLLIVPAHPLALLFFTAHMMLRNAIGHCGYEVFPARSDGRPLFDWLTTVTHHDLHHAHAGWNMGLYFTWWDRWMGTENPEYHRCFAAVAKPVRRLPVVVPAAVVMLALGGYPMNAEARQERISGHWVTPGIGAVISFEPCADGSSTLCGRLVWVWSKRLTRHLKIGGIMIRNLRWTGKRWEEGRLINPEDGRTYSGSISPAGPDLIRLKGCAGIFCQNQEWRSLRSLDPLHRLRRLDAGKP